MNMKNAFVLVTCMAAGAACAQQGRETFLIQQTQQEMQRVTGQVDVLQTNFDDLQRRVNKIEGAGDGTKGIRAEIEALKSAIAEIRRDLANQRGEIVKDLSGRISKMQRATAPAPAPAPAPVKKTVLTGPHLEYEVQSGDTLSLISQTFNVPIAQFKELNGLKNNNLRVGQKLVLPKGK